MYLNPIQARALFEQAANEHFAILAINADSQAAMVDCLESAKAVDAPVIIESSLWQLSSHSFGFGDAVAGLAHFASTVKRLAESERFASVPVIYHTDHIKGPQTLDILKPAIQGFAVPGFADANKQTASSISLDSSELTADENIALIAELCQAAVAAERPLCLEMEAGVDDGLTSVEEARYLLESVEQANPGYLALWAPGVGTKHGFSEDGFPGFSSEHVKAQHALASDICGRVIGLALHGSSGLSDEQLQDAVQAGVSKVNWSTDSLAARSAAAHAYYTANTEQLQRGNAAFKQIAMDNGVQEAIAAAYRPIVQERMQVLGGAGKGAAFCAAHAEARECSV